jgi:hypothetical protein
MTVISRVDPENLSDSAKPLYGHDLVCLATIVAFAPVFIYGFPSDSWDIRYHSLWTRHFSDQLWAGELYPRWLLPMNDGLGNPQFFYYSPLAYYFASLFQQFSTPTALTQLSLASIALLLLSGLTCYCWLINICGRTGALVGACFYVVAPFHVFVDAYARGDYAEFATYVWFPALLYGVELMRSRRAIGFAVTAASYAGLVLTHIVTGLIFSGVPFLYPLGRFEGQRRRAFFALLASLMGLALASVYLLPALMTQSEVRVPLWPVQFIFDSWTPRLLLFVNLLFVVYALALAGVAILVWRLRLGKLGSFEYTLILLCAATMVFMTGLARPLWGLFPMLQAIQMTYRLMTVIDLGLAGLIAAAATGLSRRFGEIRVLAAAVGGFFVMAAAADVGAVHFGFFNFDPVLWSKRVVHSPDYEEFRPLTAHDPLPADNLPLFSGGAGLEAEVQPVEKIVLSDGAARAEVIRWRPRNISFSIDAPTPGTAVVAQLYYPAWRAFSLTTGAALPVRPSPARGLVTIDYGAGADEIALRLVPSPAERLGWIGTGTAAVLLAFGTIVLQRWWSGGASLGRASARPS